MTVLLSRGLDTRQLLPLACTEELCPVLGTRASEALTVLLSLLWETL